MPKKLKFILLISVLCLLGTVCWGLVSRQTSISANTINPDNVEKEYPVEEANIEDDLVAASSDVKIEVVMNKVVCIDAGHQQSADMSKEPIGPGAKKSKAKVDGGTYGKKTGLTEYQLNLSIALKLQAELESRGYTVIMIRTTNDVNISNSQRAQIANEANADAFIRIHADGSDIESVHGATTLCQTADNPYNGALYEQSRSLADSVINGVVASTGCKKRAVIETDDMSGINWCQVPTTIIEVGYLSNAKEEALLATEDYQQLIATGIADGVDEYFK